MLMDQQPIPFAVSDVLQSIFDILRPMAEEKRLTMRCEGPAADQRLGHPAALNRVLLNLATNAIKFTNAGSVDVVVRELDRVRTEFSVTEEAFDPTLNPIRAKVSLGLRVLTVDDLGYSHRGGTLFLSYLRTREALAARVPGTTLQSLGLSSLP